ncbi:MAG: hypothetical protein Q7K98_07930 [Candidatus Omnitrophota bacterium]|nr:hypothetical protein [Candidatus Omnitrophota bacterium]
MSNQKRKPFLLKGNFQLTFILGFTLFLFIEVIAAGFAIYILSAKALEDAAFSSHVSFNRSLEIISPIVLKVNIWMILGSIFLACVIILIVYLNLHNLFSKIIQGLENLKNNNTAFRIDLRGNKDTRELIKEFNHTAGYLDHRRLDLHTTIDSLLKKKELEDIVKLHKKLSSII